MLSKDQELEALSWKSYELGISYGKLVSQSSPEDIRQYYGEYERRLERRQRKVKEREAARKREPRSIREYLLARGAMEDVSSGHAR